MFGTIPKEIIGASTCHEFVSFGERATESMSFVCRQRHVLYMVTSQNPTATQKAAAAQSSMRRFRVCADSVEIKTKYLIHTRDSAASASVAAWPDTTLRAGGMGGTGGGTVASSISPRAQVSAG